MTLPDNPQATPPSPTTQDDAAAAPAADGVLSLEDQLAQKTQESQERLDLLLRARADYANYRRRVDEERAQLSKEATASLVLKLLPVLDDFERAIGHASPEDLASPWGEGVQMIERKLRGILAGEGVERIEAMNQPFDPWQHEALAHQPSADVEEGHVMHVIQPGYRIGDRVIRPAQVVVARKP